MASSTLNKPAVELLPYQKRSFLDRSRFKALMWARGCRKTFTVTLEIVDDCFVQEAQGKRTTWVVLSRGERQAKEALEEVKRHCRAYRMAASDILETTFTSEDGKRSYKQFQVDFPLGSRIVALPANPDTARGYTANVFLDEFCIHQQDREIWRSLFPVLRGRFRLIVSSTPKGGKSRKFYEIMTGQDDGWSRHVVDIYQAVAEGLPLDIETEQAAMNDPDGWGQEYELQWIEDAGPWLDWELINSAEHPDAGKPEQYQGGLCYLGNDIARRGNLWVCWVVEQVGDVLWTREISELHNKKFAEHDAEMDRLFKAYRIVRGCMDQTGMGEKPVEDAKRRYGERIEGVLFSAASKTDMARIGKERFQDHKIRIPQGSRDIRADLHSLKRLITPAGNFRFDVEAQEDGDQRSHADRAWACFLATYAANNPATAIAYHALPGKRLAFGLEDYTGGHWRAG
jgi:phage FluMu gp28-like protein